VVVEPIDRLARQVRQGARSALAISGAFRLTNGHGPHEVVLRWPVAACDPEPLRDDRGRLAEAHRRAEKDASARSHGQNPGCRQNWAEHRKAHTGQSGAAEDPDEASVSRHSVGPAMTAYEGMHGVGGHEDVAVSCRTIMEPCGHAARPLFVLRERLAETRVILQS